MNKRLLLAVALFSRSIIGYAAESACETNPNSDKCEIEKLKKSNAKLESAIVLLHEKFDKLTSHVKGNDLVVKGNITSKKRVFAEGGLSSHADFWLTEDFGIKKRIGSESDLVFGTITWKDNNSRFDVSETVKFSKGGDITAKGDIRAKGYLRSERDVLINEDLVVKKWIGSENDLVFGKAETRSGNDNEFDIIETVKFSKEGNIRAKGNISAKSLTIDGKNLLNGNKLNYELVCDANDKLTHAFKDQGLKECPANKFMKGFWVRWENCDEGSLRCLDKIKCCEIKLKGK